MQLEVTAVISIIGPKFRVLYTFSQAIIPLANVYVSPYVISTEACQVELHMQN
jgi:hypothetical protein